MNLRGILCRHAWKKVAPIEESETYTFDMLRIVNEATPGEAIVANVFRCPKCRAERLEAHREDKGGRRTRVGSLPMSSAAAWGAEVARRRAKKK